MSADPAVSPRVYFEGPWRPDDQKRVTEAVANFEADRAEDFLFPDSSSWMCVAYDDGGPTALYCAHRPHLSSVLSARTARGLIKAIRSAKT